MPPKKAFTLIEVMLVVVIIGVLVAMVVPNISGRSNQARTAAAVTDIESNLSGALDLYQLDNNRYPSTEQGLRALIEKPSADPVPAKWNGPYLKKKRLPKDPWGNDYVYSSPGEHNKESYDLSSLGPNGIAGADDVTNWEKDEK